MAKWSMVIEYVRLFRNGFRPSEPVSELCRGSAPSSSDIAYTQTRFIQSIMAPDVRTNAGYGVEADLEEWRIISLHHVDLSYNLACLERGPEDSVVAHVTATTLVTANMLRRALPRHVTDEKRDEWAAISAKLVGQKLEVSTTLYFGWDREISRFISTSYESDMLTPLVRLLGSLEYASCALSSPLNVHHWSSNQCH
ncbi:hypothetical protein PR001_g18044 [Phytophthora rubi]|nr:hypothetical protein PR001_g18044 [Phytophthora rubi]